MRRTHPRVPYIQAVGSLDVPPPYHFPGVTVNAFVWEAPMGPIQSYCDVFFNIGEAKDRGFTYKPAAFWPYATLLFLDYPVMISSSDAAQDIGEVPYGDRGIVTQTEVFVAIPVVRYGVGGTNLITSTELEWMLPFITVGNPMSAVCGREMLGLGKLLATIETGESYYPHSFLGTVDLPGWRDDPEKLKRHNIQEMLRFMTVKTGPVLPTFRTSGKLRTLASLLQSKEAGWAIDGLAALSGFVGSASLGLIPTSMRTIGLKQYRDAKQVEHALYQALISCRAHYSNINSFEFYDEQDVEIVTCGHGSFKEIVDLITDQDPERKGEDLITKPVAAYRFMADIDFDSMEVVYDFPIEGPPGTPNHGASGNLDAHWFRPLKGFFGPERNS